MSRIERWLRLSAATVLAATLVTVLVAWVCSACIDVTHGTPRSAEAMTGELSWTVARWDQPGAIYVVSQTVKGWGWSPSQATGQPDTLVPGDQQTAWASLTADGQREWLSLEFAKAVVPKSVRVYENYCPGGVDRVTAFSADGKEIEAWSGVDPTSPRVTSGVSDIPLRTNFPTKKLTLYINSPAVSGWNEIDAVALVSKTDEVQWARRATASSSYGAPPAGAANVGPVKALVPPWGDLERYGDAMADENTQSETHAIDGRGWPLTALWCERNASTGAPIGGAFGIVQKAAAPAPAIPGGAGLGSSGPGPSGNWSGFLAPPVISAPPASTATAATLRTALPIRIAWQGFLADVAFYALALAALRWLIVRPWRLIVEMSRMRHGCCITCGYDLGYDFRAGCPECGWRRKDREPSRAVSAEE